MAATLRQIIIDTDSSYTGYDYSDLETAQSTEQGNISLASGTDEYVVFECYATSGAVDDTAVVINGWTTESAGGNYIEINGLLDSSYGHQGVWDATEYRLIPSTSDACIDIYESNVRVIGLQLHALNVNGQFDNAITFRPGSDNVVDFLCEKNILRGESTAIGSYYSWGVDIEDVDTGGSGTVKVGNNIIYDFGAAEGLNGGIYVYAGEVYVDSYIYNNTINDCTYGIATEGNQGAVVIINNITQNCVNQNLYYFSSGVFDSTSGYNIRDDLIDYETIWGTNHAIGTGTSYTANKLNDSGGGLLGTQVGSIVENTTDNTQTYVTVVDSDIQLTLNADIFDHGTEVYIVTTNMYGTVNFDGTTYLLDAADTVAKDKGIDLSEDSNYPISDDILGNTRS